MTDKDIINDIFGHEESTVEINGKAFKYRALTYDEYLTALKMLVENVPEKEEMVMTDPAVAIKSIESTYQHKSYVLAIMLAYNDYNPNDIKKDIRLLSHLDELYNACWSVSQPPEELIKKKDSFQ